MPTRLMICILARNEESGIGEVIKDVGNQTLLAHPDLEISLAVIANACTDNTVEVAKAALASLHSNFPSIQTEVRELVQPGKANAWNHAIHDVASEALDFVLFLDGDIRIPNDKSFALLIEKIIGDKNLVVVVDRSVKDFEVKISPSVTERILKLATGTASDPTTAIAGACYCARYSELSEIYMPLGLVGEDGYLRAMLLTSSFAHEEDLTRIEQVPDAFHLFEGITTLGEVYRHNVRLAIGTALNILLFWHIRSLRARGVDIADFIRQQNQNDPTWINQLINQRLRDSYFPLELRFLTRRFRVKRPMDRSTVAHAGIVAIGAAFDLLVFIQATRLMRRGVGAGYW